MKRPIVSLMAAIAAAGVLIVGCAPASPPPTPTKPPAAPTKAPEPTKAAAPTKAPEPTKPAEPTKAAAPQPTAAPAKKVDYPEKGKAITVIVPLAAGGASDVSIRTTIPFLEKELGGTIQVANKPGAGSQVGMTELVNSRADGYTLAMTVLPQAITIYLDPERKAVFARKDFQPIALLAADPIAIAVKDGSPYKTIKDVLDAAKANPEKVKVSTPGVLSPQHLAILQLQKLAGVKFATVHFDGGAPAVTALLGGHIDAAFSVVPDILPRFKSGEARVLTLLNKDETKFLPGVKTLESQGHKIYAAASRGLTAPAGTPKEIVDILSTAVGKSLQSGDLKKRMDEMGQDLSYMDAAAYAAYWADLEAQVIPLMVMAKQP